MPRSSSRRQSHHAPLPQRALLVQVPAVQVPNPSSLLQQAQLLRRPVNLQPIRQEHLLQHPLTSRRRSLGQQPRALVRLQRTAVQRGLRILVPAQLPLQRELGRIANLLSPARLHPRRQCGRQTTKGRKTTCSSLTRNTKEVEGQLRLPPLVATSAIVMCQSSSSSRPAAARAPLLPHPFRSLGLRTLLSSPTDWRSTPES
mmetsp:Transcript_3629/g.10518  ORF Transcript_3629/g.10518 Transcript_3629/m.10518 type:complete len:201 (-) Transcript_3629:3156-3758(-)